MKLYLVFFILFLGPYGFAIPGTEKGISTLREGLRAEATVILKRYQELMRARAAKTKINLDLEDGMFSSIYNKAGIFSSEECMADTEALTTKKERSKTVPCVGIGWPDNKAEITPTGALEFVEAQDEEGNVVLQTYVEVKFKYERMGTRKGTGWIANDFLSVKPVNPSYKEIFVEKWGQAKNWIAKKYEDMCTHSPKASAPLALPRAANKNILDIAKTAEAIEKNIEVKNKERKTVSETAEGLAIAVGKCVLSPPNKAPGDFEGNIAYDKFALPAIKSTPLPLGVKNEDGKELSRENLLDIDALARTIFAEMASCTPIGAQYPMAVARVIRNREMAMIENAKSVTEFIKNNNEHDQVKSLISKAATSPVLFSAWNKDVIDFPALKAARESRAGALRSKRHTAKANARANRNIKADPDSKLFYKKNNSGLLHTLCPPSDPEGQCYTGAKPDQNLTAVWKNTLKVATEAILFPKQFEIKTAELEGIKHYTSNRDKFYDFKMVQPSIEGRPVSSKRCLNLWVPSPKKKK